MLYIRSVSSYSSFQRSKLVEKAQEDTFDLVIIGGGITGAGIALDAASRGLKTLLLEKNDFSSGTSSKSTKLIHGGLRYLKQFEIALVREVGRERAVVHRLAPHLVTSEKMLLPLIKDGSFGKLMTSVGLMVYDILAGVESADQRVMLDKEETLKKEPLLNEEVVLGSGLYAEYRTDDSRLTIEVIKTAVNQGAVCLNYAEVNEFIYEDGKIVGVKVIDRLSDLKLSVESSNIVSAAGPWVDELRSKDASLTGKTLHLTKGVHLVFDRDKLPVSQAIYFDVPDGRMIFAIPRGNVTYVGTTDTNYDGDKNRILTDKVDAEYLLRAVNNTFGSLNLTIDDVASSWAGVRPLIHEEGKSASELSRKDEIFVSPSGLMSIAGGKLTGYRKMSERITDMVMERIVSDSDAKFVKCKTEKIDLTGGPFKDHKEVKRYRRSLEERLSGFQIDEYYAWYLTATYGRQSDTIVSKLEQLIDSYKDPLEALIVSEMDYCLESEFIFKTTDFAIRRTGRLFFDIESVNKYSHTMVSYLASRCNWDDARITSEKKEMEEAIFEASQIFKG